MAPWEELVLACNLKADVPSQVIDILDYLINETTGELEVISTPDHHFFAEYGWQDLLRGFTYYFPGEPFARLTRDIDHGFYNLAQAHRSCNRTQDYLNIVCFLL